MKIAPLFLLACLFTFVAAGCSEEKNAVITDDLTQDDFAQYEADLAKANGEANYDDEDMDE